MIIVIVFGFMFVFEFKEVGIMIWLLCDFD